MGNPLGNSETAERFVAATDALHLVKTQNCEPIIKAIHAVPDISKRVVNTQSARKYLGSVPTLVALAWAKEWGVRLYTKEWMRLAAHRVKTDPNWNKLRVR